jgi:hypothetical protein
MTEIKHVNSGSKLFDDTNTFLLCPICGSSRTRIGYALVNITDRDKIVTMGVSCENSHVFSLQFCDDDGSVYLNSYGAYDTTKSKAEEISNTVIKKTQSRLKGLPK